MHVGTNVHICAPKQFFARILVLFLREKFELHTNVHKCTQMCAIDKVICFQLAVSAIAPKTQMVIAQQTADILLTHCGNEARQSIS